MNIGIIINQLNIENHLKEVRDERRKHKKIS